MNYYRRRLDVVYKMLQTMVKEADTEGNIMLNNYTKIEKIMMEAAPRVTCGDCVHFHNPCTTQEEFLGEMYEINALSAVCDDFTPKWQGRAQ